jgi:hypothetical protein
LLAVLAVLFGSNTFIAAHSYAVEDLADREHAEALGEAFAAPAHDVFRLKAPRRRSDCRAPAVRRAPRSADLPRTILPRRFSEASRHIVYRMLHRDNGIGVPLIR